MCVLLDMNGDLIVFYAEHEISHYPAISNSQGKRKSYRESESGVNCSLVVVVGGSGGGGGGGDGGGHCCCFHKHELWYK